MGGRDLAHERRQRDIQRKAQDETHNPLTANYQEYWIVALLRHDFLQDCLCSGKEPNSHGKENANRNSRDAFLVFFVLFSLEHGNIRNSNNGQRKRHNANSNDTLTG